MSDSIFHSPDVQAEMDALLVAECGPLAGQSFVLAQNETTIGRQPENHVRLSDSRVSRVHCRITREAGRFCLRDLGSSNHTYVNDVQVAEHWLTAGDRIRVHTTVLRFVTTEEASLPADENAARWEADSPHYLPTLVLRQGDNAYLQAARKAPDERWLSQYRLLLQCCQEMNEQMPLAALTQRLLERLASVLPAQRGALVFPGDETAQSYSWERGRGQVSPFPLSQSIVNDVLTEGKTKRFNYSESAEAPASLVSAAVQTVAALPLTRAGEIFGVVYLDTRDPLVQFDEEPMELAEALATLAAGALYRAWQQARHNTHQAQQTGRYVLIGESTGMQEVRKWLGRYALKADTVLITGETGAGKEVIARTLHWMSGCAGEFVAVNCATIPRDLLENELFGHEKGAFTGANKRYKGRFEQAEGGTLFLDEIGEMHADLQAKLLRVLQEREFERLGGDQKVHVNLRVIAATNQDLKAALDAGNFRQDLYYRLNVLPIHLPPLRERRADIPLLAEHFLKQRQQETKLLVEGIAADAMACLAAYDWPGNVRELENVLARSLSLCESDLLRREDLPTEIAQQTIAVVTPPEQATAVTHPLTPVTAPIHNTAAGRFDLTQGYQAALRQARQQIIRQAMLEAGSYQDAAEQLQMHTNNLHRLIRELGLKEELKEGGQKNS